MTDQRVMITGMGAVSAAGVGHAALRRAVRAGESCIAPITTFDTARSPITIGGQVAGFRPEEFLDRKLIARTPRNTHFAFIAADEAFRSSGLDLASEDPTRVGSVMGTTIGGTEKSEQGIAPFYAKGPRFISPFLVTTMLCNGAMSQLSIKYNLRGFTQTLVSEAAGGGDAIRVATALIREGELDVALVGGNEATLWNGFVLLFAGLGLHARRQDDPQGAYRPFDRCHDGLVLGEGGALLVLESEAHARARGARLLAEVAGYGATFDAADPIDFATDGQWYAAALRGAMAQAGVIPREIDAVIAEGRATPAADQAEANALLLALDGARPPITCSKGVLGHAFSAAGALDAIGAVDMIEDGVIPPIANFVAPGVGGDLDFVAGQGRRADVRTVLLGARGLSGINVGLVLRRVG